MQEHLSPTPASSMKMRLKARWKPFQLAWERRSMESKLASVLRSAQGHESNGTPAGDRQYNLLREQAESICTRFANRWEIDPELLKAQIPGLSKLSILAQPVQRKPLYALAILFIIGTPLLFFIVGVVAGLMSMGFHLVGGH